MSARHGAPTCWLLFGLALALAHNLVAWWSLRRWGDFHVGFQRLNPVLGALLLVLVLGRRRTSPSAVGWHGASARTTGLGLATGLLLSLPPLLAFRFPPGRRDRPVRFAHVERLPPRAFLRRLLVDLPLVTVLVEELAYRGVLEAGLRRTLSPRGAALVSATLFAAGHAVLNDHAYRATNLPGAWPPRPLALLGGLGAVWVGGLAFSWLRHQGGLWPPALAHWLVDALMLTALYRLGRGPDRTAPAPPGPSGWRSGGIGAPAGL